jgi:3-oxoacyl-[acyl-carrier-protein] synthase II
MNAVVVAGEMVAAYGQGFDASWRGLLSGRTALALSDRIPFSAGARKTPLGIVPDVVHGSVSRSMQMLDPMLRSLLPVIPANTLLLLATTVGEIEYLEAATLKRSGAPAIAASDPGRLLDKLCSLCGLRRGRVFSAACASSTIAVAQAAALISSGVEDSVLVIACDAVSEFVNAGFATMNALDPAGAHPFDRDRQGLNLGEAAAIALLMSGVRAAREQRPVFGTITGWASSNDATHVTRPERTGVQLARAIRQAMKRAGVEPDQIDFISAHGTGTGYNDAMEMAALRSLFSPRPVFSVKGAWGHTLGAAGLLEILISLRALSEGIVPPTIGMRHPDDCASGWVTECPTFLTHGTVRTALTINSGFGGINAALVLTNGTLSPDRSSPYGLVAIPAQPLSPGIGWINRTACGLIRHRELRDLTGKNPNGGGSGSVDALFHRKIERFGRFDPVSRMTCLACELALRDADVDFVPESLHEVGILGAGFNGSLAANSAFFKDYVESGRILARGNLFVYTLPTAPLGEAAIHFGLRGPLFSMIAPATPLSDSLEVASRLVKSGDAPAMLVVQADADSAVAALVTAGFPSNLAQLSTLAASSPHLSQLIPKLTVLTESHGL